MEIVSRSGFEPVRRHSSPLLRVGYVRCSICSQEVAIEVKIEIDFLEELDRKSIENLLSEVKTDFVSRFTTWKSVLRAAAKQKTE